MAKTTITICNMENDKERAFVFSDEFAFDFNDTHRDIINFLRGADWEVVYVEMESDLQAEVEKALRSYIEDNFTLDKEALEHMLEQIAELETEAEYTSDVVTLWNEYCDATYHYDDQVFYFDEEFLDMASTDKFDLVRKILYGDVHPNNEYACFNGYGNIVTTDYPIEDCMDVDDLVKWYIEER